MWVRSSALTDGKLMPLRIFALRQEVGNLLGDGNGQLRWASSVAAPRWACR